MPIFTASFRTGRLSGPGFNVLCGLGKSGIITADQKREGDGKSPIGIWPVRKVLYRADRILEPPRSSLILDSVTPEDGWCDDPKDPAYNRPILKPYPNSHEDLWRSDRLYDLIITLGHNDNPPVAGLGSAIFLHCAQYDNKGLIKPTLGCVSVSKQDLIHLVSILTCNDFIEITD